jgi:hypothetical protein
MGVEQAAERAMRFFVSAAAQNFGAMSRGHCGAVNMLYTESETKSLMCIPALFRVGEAERTSDSHAVPTAWILTARLAWGTAALHLSSTSRVRRLSSGSLRGGQEGAREVCHSAFCCSAHITCLVRKVGEGY